ncbi:hypothetical protein ACFVFS_17510 [Kitasatospora sp. NPDC057692]|uniref:hypothetical protein n=1 Tax=Kitasatospora sp. NPDC057692 TaxID=3346215 RepID=UPI0036AF6918
MNQPLTQHPAIATYEKATNGIPDCFDHLTATQISECAQTAAQDRPWTTPASEAAKFITGHFGMLDTWHDALDELDSELRAHVVAGGLPDDQVLYLQLAALALFSATESLRIAVCEHHYGLSGPKLSADYGHAYPLSNSALSPFGATAGAR